MVGATAGATAAASKPNGHGSNAEAGGERRMVSPPPLALHRVLSLPRRLQLLEQRARFLVAGIAVQHLAKLAERFGLESVQLIEQLREMDARLRVVRVDL